jgi:hypothetical protein
MPLLFSLGCFRMSSFIACEADHISVPEMWEHSTAFDEGGFDSDEVLFNFC